MGSSVSLQLLGISLIQQSSESLEEEQFKPEEFQGVAQKELKFPCFLALSEKEGIDCVLHDDMQTCTLPALYRLSLSGFAALSLQRLQHSKQNKLWRYLLKGETVQLGQGDSLKVGSLQLKLKYLMSDEAMQKMQPLQSQNIETRKCRICFEEDENSENPMLCLCRCEGSVKFTHFSCLRTWVGQKVKQVEEINCTYYEYNPFSCEICLHSLPAYFMHRGKLLSLIEKQSISPPYAILQKQPNRHDKVISYRVKLQEGLSVSVGRSSQSNIPLINPTVSRNHCILYYTHKQIYVKDLQSKYGTKHFTRNNQFSFNSENGAIIELNGTKIKISTFKKKGLSLEIPKICCAVPTEMKMRIIDDSDEKFTVETSRDFFDFFD